MVEKVKINSKHAFWKALIFTVIVFALGLIMGVFLESSKTDDVQLALLDSEVALLDAQLRERVVDDFDVSCDIAKEQLFMFADKIYEEAADLEEVAGSSHFSKDIIDSLHRRYDLLRSLLWAESVKLKESCGDFDTLVYLYEFNSEDLNVESRQVYYSRLALDMKLAHEHELVLIPIAANMGLDSIDILMESYGIESLPVLIANEKDVVYDIVTFDELENIVFDSNN